MSKVIALSADYQYVNQIEATIKSVLYNNEQIKFYLINSDIPQEWFYNMNRHLKSLHSKIIDLKINMEDLANQAPERDYISQIAWGRFMIPELIPEQRVLYLDSDTIVNGNLTPLFRMDLGDYPLAAARDITGDYIFNDGVMLLNNAKLQEDPDLVNKLLKAGEEHLEAPDQQVLNNFFGDSFLELDSKYNYLIGLDVDMTYIPDAVPNYDHIMEQIKNPIIYHYVATNKPWKLTCGGRYCDLWWQYKNLDWYELIMQRSLPLARQKSEGQMFTFTNSADLEHLEDLLKALPNWQFNVASWTEMSNELMNLIKYPNLRLIPRISRQLLQQIVDSSDAYLDINNGEKERSIINQFITANKPVLAFWAPADHYQELDDYARHIIVGDDDMPTMLNDIQNIKNH